MEHRLSPWDNGDSLRRALLTTSGRTFVLEIAFKSDRIVNSFYNVKKIHHITKQTINALKHGKRNTYLAKSWSLPKRSRSPLAFWRCRARSDPLRGRCKWARAFSQNDCWCGEQLWSVAIAKTPWENNITYCHRPGLVTTHTILEEDGTIINCTQPFPVTSCEKPFHIFCVRNIFNIISSGKNIHYYYRLYIIDTLSIECRLRFTNTQDVQSV